MARPRIARGESGAVAEAGSATQRRETQLMGLEESGPTGQARPKVGQAGPAAASVQAS